MGSQAVFAASLFGNNAAAGGKAGQVFKALSISQEWKALKSNRVWTTDSTQESLKIKSVELN